MDFKIVRAMPAPVFSETSAVPHIAGTVEASFELHG